MRLQIQILRKYLEFEPQFIQKAAHDAIFFITYSI